jgi:hypothetical protein
MSGFFYLKAASVHATTPAVSVRNRDEPIETALKPFVNESCTSVSLSQNQNVSELKSSVSSFSLGT